MSILETESDRLLAAVRALLTGKGILSADEIAERIAVTDKGSPAQGARMVARAWTDPAYRARMLADGAAASASVSRRPGSVPRERIAFTPGTGTRSEERGEGRRN